jgi:hypothetical protein
MRVFGVTFYKRSGRYDEFHASYETACSNYEQCCSKLLPGETLILLRIDLAGRMAVAKLQETAA